MINHEPQDTTPFDRAQAGSNPTNEGNDTPRPTSRRIEIDDCPEYPIKRHKMAEKQTSRREFLGRSLKTGLALVIPTILTGKARGDTITYNNGKLEIYNKVDDPFNFSTGFHTTFHYPGAIEEYQTFWDKDYIDPLWRTPVYTKIVSIIPEHKLRVDTRPLESFTPVDLELSLHTQSGSPITVSNLENWLKCVLDPNTQEYFFNPKPITLWRRFLAEPDKLQFLADIREVCYKSEERNENGAKIGRVPIYNLNGEYQSQFPYDYLQVRFDVYPGDIDFNGKVDMKDLHYVGKDWLEQGQPLDFLGDITGPQGLPDGRVDSQDFAHFARHWFKDIREIMP